MEPKNNPRLCKYCRSEIHRDAKVCAVCGKHQNWFKENVAHSISFLVFILAIAQLIFATLERNKAEDAYMEAMTARNEIVKAKKDIRLTESKLAEVGDAVVVIVDILPRSTGYGAGISDNDRFLLNKSIAVIKEYRESLNVKLK
jgi:hypothetical protein